MSARRLVLSLCVIVGVVMFACAPALAAAPETPETGSASAITANTATLEGGVLNPNAAGEPGEYEYLYKASETECEGGSVAPVPEGVAVGIEKEVVPPVKLSGLKAVQAYTFCLVERNAANPGEVSPTSAPVTFTTLPAQPVTESEYASYIESSAAILNAQIDPDGETTTYHFQYGTSESYGQSTPETALAESGTANFRITSLEPATTYHYRVVATNSLSPAGGTPGPDRTFTTPAVLGSEPAQHCANEQRRAEQPYALGLPDCRAYEMVSPLETDGNDATDSFIAPARAAVSGEAIVYSSRGTFANPTGATGENEFISRRGPEGWSTQSVTPLHDPEQAETEASFPAQALTPELTEGIAETSAELTPETPLVPRSKLYLDDFPNSSYRYIGNENKYPLGTSTDLSHVVFGEFGSVAEWVNGNILPVSVANDGESMDAGVGAMAPNTTYVSSRDLWHAVSADGSYVYFTSPQAETQGTGQLYVRENADKPQSLLATQEANECTEPAKACTIDVSASQRSTPDTHGAQTARYWGASADGSRAFFSSNAELTEDAYTGPADDAANLYEYDLERPEGERLKDLTVDKADADGAGVLGVVQISEDGSYVYFVATGDLATGATAGLPNLYVVHDDGAPVFVATLAANDVEDWHVGSYEGEGGPEENTAVVAPSGSRLAFVSEKSLTGYDNEQAEPGECENQIGRDANDYETGRCREAYLYDAGTGELVCASCDSSGARPVGPSSFSTTSNAPYDLYRSRNLLENGTLFFDSSDELVSHTSDGRRNVYEYENGRVYAISDVAGGYESFFLDASANGENVFFGSADDLLPQDVSNSVVVYDARVGGGFPISVAPPSCDNGDSCKPPQAPQTGVFGAPGSATFSGPGNIAPAVVAKPAVKAKAKPVKCKKGYEKKKGKCVKKRKSKKAKKSSDRRGSK